MSNRMKVEIKRLPHASDLPLPHYATQGSAGLDLLAAVDEPIELLPGQRMAVPTGIAIDPAGNIYIADSGNNRIREVSSNTGFISTIAGNGTAGYTGDTALASAAELAHSLAELFTQYVGDDLAGGKTNRPTENIAH